MWWVSNSNADTDADTDADGHSNADANADSNTNSDTNSNTAAGCSKCAEQPSRDDGVHKSDKSDVDG